ncbi:MAG TPA: hypothetical protein PLY87_01910 [Planctomycetaceae bacterium]|nr:hypothetical protein [Planctomycetaceae bacterium]
MKTKCFTRDLKIVAHFLRLEYCNWLDKVGTLAELLTLLESIRDEFLYFKCDALICDHVEELGDLADFIRLWDDPSKPDIGPSVPHTFSYRMGIVEDDIDSINMLIRGVGGAVRLSDLPKLKRRKGQSEVVLIRSLPI